MYSKILTINEIYSDNIGDQAIADAMLLALNNKADIIERADYSFGTDISYLLNIKVMERLRFIKTLIPSNLKKMMSLIIKFPYAYKFAKNKYDIAIIGGGQLILSNYSFAVSMFLWVTILKLYGTKIKIISVGVGDNFSIFDKILFKLSLSKIDAIYLRDQISINNLTNIFNIKSFFIPDIAYYLKNSTSFKFTKNILIAPIEYSVHERYAEEMGNTLMNQAEHFSWWRTYILDKAKNNQNILICPTTVKDYLFSSDLIHSIQSQQKNIKLVKCRTWNDFMLHASTAEFVSSGRMHALILGHIVGARIEPIFVSNKLIAYANQYLSDSAKSHRLKIIKIMKKV